MWRQSLLPNDKPRDNIADLSHYAGVEWILNLQTYKEDDYVNLNNNFFSSFQKYGSAHKNQLTHIQKKNAISKAFWKRMKWIKMRTISGWPNQKCSSDGLTTSSPSIATCFSATSWANCLMTCSSLVPTASRSYKKETERLVSGWKFDPAT